MKNLMRKVAVIVPVAAIILFTAVKVNAQTAEIGFRLMPTISAFDMKTSSGGTVKGSANLGYGIGAFVGYNFTNNIGVQGEVMYSSITQKYTQESVERKVNLRYVNIPLLFSLNTGKTNAVNLNLVAGPQIGISVGSKVFTSGGDGTNQAMLTIKKGDLGVAYGAGVDFALGSSGMARLGVGFRGVYGLLNISDNNNSTTTNSLYVLDRTHIKTYSLYTGLSLLF